MRDSYVSGFKHALEKLGFALGSTGGQSAGTNLGGAFKVTTTRSVSKPAGLSTKSRNVHLSPSRAEAATPKLGGSI